MKHNITLAEISNKVTDLSVKKVVKRLAKYALAWMVFEAVVGSAVGLYFGVMYPEQVLAYVESLK